MTRTLVLALLLATLANALCLAGRFFMASEASARREHLMVTGPDPRVASFASASGGERLGESDLRPALARFENRAFK